MFKRVFLVLVFAGFISSSLFLNDSPAAAAQNEPIPDEAIISGISGKAQSYKLSCESRSAADWAAFWGVEISESEFLSQLPRSDDPNEGFVGNPNHEWGQVPPNSYGVHADPVATLLRAYGLQAEAHHALDWDDLRLEIASGRPVIVWIIGQIWRGSPRTYITASGMEVVVAPFEHTMILYGYDANHVRVIDAFSGQFQSYSLEAFLRSWSVLGNMAITGFGKTPIEADPEPVAAEISYVVNQGDYLVHIAERFGINWKTIVAFNELIYPYTLGPDQVLILPLEEGMPAPELSKILETNPNQENLEVVSGELVYIVESGDTLGKIGEQLGVNWLILAEYNDIAPPFTLYTGQTIKWERKPDTPTVPEETSDETEQQTYRVQRGDTLYTIAQKFGISWQSLAQLNQINFPYVIYAGQELRLK
jgi:LysM repeat protein/uncharacterized protein YvpB